jgi:hypothetical protein
MTAYWLIVAFLLGGALGASMAERRAWNRGICRQTGEPWVYFDTDSQGGRGYKSGKHCTWISWPGIDSLRCEQREGSK